MKNENYYTTQLQAGLGMIEETRVLLNLWLPEMNATQLQNRALESGELPNVSARRLRNIVSECFSPRFLVGDPPPAIWLKRAHSQTSTKEFEQLLFIYTCRANLILADFVRDVYWNMYSAGGDVISTDDAVTFVIRANQDGKTRSSWSESTVHKVSTYLSGCCADFGLLEAGRKKVREILPFRIEPRVAVFLAYELHFSGLGDNSVLSHADWLLFGMDRADVLEELKRQALNGWFIIQSAGDVIRIGWSYHSMEEFVDAFIKR